MLCNRLRIRNVDELLHTFRPNFGFRWRGEKLALNLEEPRFRHLVSHLDEFFCDRDVIPPIVFRIIRYRCPDLTRKFLAFGVDPNLYSGYFSYPALASASGIADCRMLLEAGAAVTIPEFNFRTYKCLPSVVFKIKFIEYTFLATLMIEVGLG